MDKQARGLLLVEKEEAEEDIRKFTDQLSKMGNTLTTFGHAVMNSPAGVIFANAPINLGSVPEHVSESSPFPWNEIPDKETVARLIQELRKAMERLKSLQQQLDAQ